MNGIHGAKGKSRFALLCLFVLCWTAVSCSCAKKPAAETARSMGVGWFEVGADELGTRANGVIEIYEKEQNALGIRILADLRIGPTDYGGVAVFLPAGCRLEGVSCTYPETDGAAGGDPPVNIWSTASDQEKYAVIIEIGRDREKVPGGGGSGTVVIEASYPSNDSDPVKSLTFGVECGAKEKNGSVIMGVGCCEITVEIEPFPWKKF